MTKNRSYYYAVNPKIIFRREGKEAILYNTDSGDMEILNKTGVFIFKLCNGRNTLEDIVSKALKRYTGHGRKIRLDIKRFIIGLKKNKTIEVVR